MSYANLLVHAEAQVLTITINRPKVLNALNADTLRELGQAVEAAADDAGVRVIVMTGTGTRAFAAGADITELATQTPTEGREHAQRGQAVFDRIERLGKPVIAAVNGYALGGGCELAMACTLRVAADTATFGQPEVNLGLTPGYAGTQRLPRLIGRGRALELLLTGAQISADEAWRIGLVNRVVPAGELMTHVMALAATIAAKPAQAVRYVLDAVGAGLEMPFAEAAAHEAALFGLAFATEDMREGTAAFLAKRPPVFKGR